MTRFFVRFADSYPSLSSIKKTLLNAFGARKHLLKKARINSVHNSEIGVICLPTMLVNN